eukprot:TRINITY_DN6450_c0_g1_i1.p1 TRINITY_DN6450_c0_g1~~TRINITY_DN6450_c0_g1_i1.p1  ORF type:complete len:581 (-),score=23.45 TRINITY_DN6450_c0_g1_i1:57-1799(-)
MEKNTGTGARQPDGHPPASKRRKTEHKNIIARLSWSEPPQDIFHVLFDFLSLTDTITLCLVCKYWNKLTKICVRSLDCLDLSCFNRLAPNVLVFLVGIALEGGGLKRLISKKTPLDEKAAGVLGYLFLENKKLSRLDFTGSMPGGLLREIQTYCPNLECLWKMDNQQTAEVCESTGIEKAFDGRLLADLLQGCPKLADLRIGAVDFVGEMPRSEAPTAIEHFALRVLHIENMGFETDALTHFPTCKLPNLREFVITEKQDSILQGGCIPFEDVLHVIWNSVDLEKLEISAHLNLTVEKCKQLVERVPKLSWLSLKPYTSTPEGVRPVERRLNAEALHLLLEGLPLQTLSLENVEWEEHWTTYTDLQPPFLMLQSPIPSTSVIIQNIERFSKLRSCVLFGSVSNEFVHTLLMHCHELERLELYVMDHHAEVDDELFSAAATTAVTTLRTLHLHYRPRGGPEKLSHHCLQNLDKFFPNLCKLAVLGLSESETALCQTLSKCGTHVQYLVLGPVLRTTTELLQLVKSCSQLRKLDLCWDGGSLPRSDEEFTSALGTTTMWRILNKINPTVVVRDAGGGHFAPV